MPNDNIRDSIFALKSGDSSAFKDTIQGELLNRAKESISTQRIVAGQTFFDEPQEIEMSDEVDDSQMKLNLEPEETPNEDIQATLNSEPKLVIDELTENKISETNTREAIENLIVEEIKNEIEADAEEDLNLLSNITEKPDNDYNDYNELLNVQSLLEKTQQELELYKKMTTEKDHRILELKNQFKQFVQNLA